MEIPESLLKEIDTMDERRGDQAEGRASRPQDEPASPPLPRPQSYQKTRKPSYKGKWSLNEGADPIRLGPPSLGPLFPIESELTPL
jgi:hypothetical protein